MSINKLGKVQVNTNVVIKLTSVKEYEECLDWFNKNSADEFLKVYTWTNDWCKFIHAGEYGWKLATTGDQTHTWAEFLKEYDADVSKVNLNGRYLRVRKGDYKENYLLIQKCSGKDITAADYTVYTKEYPLEAICVNSDTRKQMFELMGDGFTPQPPPANANRYLDKCALINSGVTAIHCETRSELEYVIEKTNHVLSLESIWQAASNKACIREDGKSWEKLDYWTDSGADIITFKTWCSRHNYDPPFYRIEKEEFKVGDIVCVIKECPNDRYTALNGQFGKLTNILSGDNYKYCVMIKGNPQSQSVHFIRKATPAEIIEYSISDPNQNKFEKGDYVVTLGTTGACAKTNYCFKVRETHHYLLPVKDVDGGTSNGNNRIQYNNPYVKWRYATPEEAAKYDIIGEPYDVTIFASDIYVPLQTSNVVSHFPSANPISKKRPKIEVVKKQIKKLTTIKQ